MKRLEGCWSRPTLQGQSGRLLGGCWNSPTLPEQAGWISEPCKVGPFYRLPEPSKDSHGLAGRLLPKQFRSVHFHYASANPSWQFSLLNMQYPVEDIRSNARRKKLRNAHIFESYMYEEVFLHVALRVILLQVRLGQVSFKSNFFVAVLEVFR